MAAAKHEFEPTEQDVQIIREWLIKMPHLVDHHSEDTIRAMIRACKGSLHKTKETFERFNSLGSTYPDMFGHLDPFNEVTQYFLNNTYIFLMPKKTNDGSIILIATSRKDEIDTRKFNIFEFPRYLVMCYLVLVYENNLGSSKFIFIADYRCTKLSEIKTVTPTYLKNFIQLLRGFPIRLQAAHSVNLPHFLQSFSTFLLSLLPKRLADRLHFHTSGEELNKMIPKEFLPDELGGDAGDLDTLHNLWKRKVESHRNRLILEHQKMRELDHLRPKPNNNNEYYGTFRKLEVD